MSTNYSDNYSDEFDLDVRIFASTPRPPDSEEGVGAKKTKKTCVETCKKTCKTCETCRKTCETCPPGDFNCFRA
jgi:hypothetical protein